MIQLRHLLLYLAAAMSAISLGVAGCTQQRIFEEETPANYSTTQVQSINRDVPYVPTPNVVVQEMLKLANLTKEDILYDLGSGDGRIVINAVENYGVRGVGVEIDPELIQQAQENAKKSGVSDRVEFRQQDLFQTDISEATVVTLYLLPKVNLRLKSKLLEELKPGTRIISHAFDMGEWEPEKVVEVEGRTIYYWVVPDNLEKRSL